MPSGLLSSGRFAHLQEFGGDSAESAAEGCEDDQKDDRQNCFEGMLSNFRRAGPSEERISLLLFTGKVKCNGDG
jgi:hypothetical protein